MPQGGSTVPYLSCGETSENGDLKGDIQMNKSLPNDRKQCTVYVTAGAWKYHEIHCSHLNRSVKPKVDLPLEKAEKLEYSRCDQCNP